MAEWVVEDTFRVGKREMSGPSGAGSTGVLENADFPNRVESDEAWTGTIDAVNTGDESETFRVLKNGSVKATFDLSAGGTKTINFEGTGPETFTITLESKVEKGFWEKYRTWIIVGVLGASAGAVGYASTRGEK